MDEKAVAMLACRKRHARDEYDSAMSFNQLKEFLKSVGISPSDIDPENLGFHSGTFFECLEKADDIFWGRDERAIAHYACGMRHSDRNFREDRRSDAT
jgi:hypothetical protein